MIHGKLYSTAGKQNKQLLPFWNQPDQAWKNRTNFNKSYQPIRPYPNKSNQSHPNQHQTHSSSRPSHIHISLPYRVFLVVITPAGGAPPVHGTSGAATVTDTSAASAEATANDTAAAAATSTAARFVIVRRVPMTTATVLGDIVESGRRGGRTGRRCA